MAMFYSTNKRYQSSNSKGAKWLFAIVALLVFATVFFHVPRFVAEWVYGGVYGIAEAEDAMRERVAYDVLMREEKEVLAREVVRLRKEVQMSMYDKELLSQLAHEREELIFVLGGAPRAIADVRGEVVEHRSIFTASMLTVRLPVGADVAEGSGVETLAGVPVGTVLDVVNGVAAVSPYASMTDPFSIRIGVGSSTVHTTAKGRGVETLVARVPRGVTVALGTPVYVPGAVEPVGVVREEVSLPEDAERDLYITLAADVRELKYVRFVPPLVSFEVVDTDEDSE